MRSNRDEGVGGLGIRHRMKVRMTAKTPINPNATNHHGHPDSRWVVN